MAGNEVVINVRADSKQAERAMDNVGNSAQRLSKRLSNLRGPLLAVSGAMTALAGVSIKFAADLEQAQGKANEVFGDSVNIINEFADTSAEAFGISRRAALDYSGTLGLILQNSGQTAEASAQMATELSALGADLAAFANVPVPQALDKIRSGLVGEIEPLRQVGISFNAAAVEAKAMEMGLADANEELTEGQKVTARYHIITEQMSDIQGQFARESDTLNGQLSTLKASMEDLAASLGKRLIPVATDMVEKLNTAVRVFSALPREVQNATLIIGGLTGALAGLGLVLPPLIAAITFLLGPAGIIVVGVGAAVAAGVLLAKNWEFVRDVGETVYGALGEMVEGFVNHYIRMANVIIRVTKSITGPIGALAGMLGVLPNEFEEIDIDGAKAFNSVADTIEGFSDDIQAEIDGIKNRFDEMGQSASGLAQDIEAGTGNMAGSMNQVTTATDSAAQSFERMTDAMTGLERLDQMKVLQSPGAMLGFPTTEEAVEQFNTDQREAFLRDLQSWADRLTEVAQETGDVETAISIMRSRLDRLNVPAQSQEFEILGTAIASLRDRMGEVAEETQRAGMEMKRLQEISDRGIAGNQAQAREAFAQSLTREEALANLTNLLEVRARIRQTSPGSRRLRDFGEFLAGQGSQASELLGLGAQDFADFFPGQQVDPQVVGSLRGTGDPETVARLEQIIGAIERQFDRDIVVNIDGREVARSQGDRALSSEGTRLN